MNIISVNIPPKIPFKKIVKTLNYPYIRSSNAEVIYKIEESSFIFLYALGAYVLVNVAPAAAIEFKEKLLSLVPDIESEIKQELYEESYQLLINKKRKISVTDSDITLPSLKLEYLRIVSLVLAESVSLDYHENAADLILNNSLQLTRELRDTGRYSIKKKDLMRFIGQALTIRQKILNNLFISDSPDEVWARPELERMFKDLHTVFDIEPRYRSLSMSLNAVQDSLGVLSNLLQTAEAKRLEWIIIILIFTEIVLSFIR